MSKKTTKKKSLHLLEKLVQDSDDTNHGRQLLYDSLISETSNNTKMNGKAREKNKNNVNKNGKDSKVKLKVSSENKKKLDSISIPLHGVEENSRNSRPDSKTSSSSFWSPRSRSRSRSRTPPRKTRTQSDSRSRSRTPPRRGRSRSDSRSRSRTPPRRRSRSSSSSRSRTPPRRARTRSESSSRSRTPPRRRSRSLSDKRSSRSSSYSSEFDVSNSTNNKTGDNGSKNTSTEQLNGKKTGKKKKLLRRSPMRKFRSMEIDPDLFMREKLNQKYQELHELVHGNFGESRPQVTRKYLYQMEILRDQYKKVSHGLPPSGIILPGDVPSRNKKNLRPQSATVRGGSTLGEDNAYGTIFSVMNGSIARDKNFIRTDVHDGHRPRPKNKKKVKASKRKDSHSTIDTNDYSVGKTNSSRTGSSPRSQVLPPDSTDHHIKNSNNTDLLKWLKKKDALHRKQKREERRQKREERDKAVMDANEKFERRLESKKKVDTWMAEKKIEARLKYKEERKKRKQEAMVNNLINASKGLGNEKLAGKAIRPQSAPPERKEGHSDYEKEIIHKTREEEEEKKQASMACKNQSPHPPASKFIYKRPVAGRIKLSIRPQSATTAPAARDKSKSPDRADKPRMSYDDWLKEKRKQDIRKSQEAKLEKEALANTDPELEKIIPDIAQKRIHRVLEGKKRIDTGLKKYDEKANRSFGGSDFDSDDTSPTRYSYKLEQDRPPSTRKANPKALKVSGQAMQGSERPQTAPASNVPAPKVSTSSPRKAVQAKDQRSDEVSSAFRVPFPEENGVPPHVASMQRKLFAEKVWTKLEEEERPEPQGCDSTDSPKCPPAKVDKVDDRQQADSADDTREDSSQNNNADESASTHVDNKSPDNHKDEEPGHTFFVTEMTGDLPTSVQQQLSDTNEETDNNMNGTDKCKEKVELTDKETFRENNENDNTETFEENNDAKDTETQKETDEEADTSVNVSHSAKHVSFCEETEILGKAEGTRVDWSTDTASSDGDDYAADQAKRDLEPTEDVIDGYGTELNNSVDTNLPDIDKEVNDSEGTEQTSENQNDTVSYDENLETGKDSEDSQDTDEEF